MCSSAVIRGFFQQNIFNSLGSPVVFAYKRHGPLPRPRKFILRRGGYTRIFARRSHLFRRCLRVLSYDLFFVSFVFAYSSCAERFHTHTHAHTLVCVRMRDMELDHRIILPRRPYQKTLLCDTETDRRWGKRLRSGSESLRRGPFPSLPAEEVTLSCTVNAE